MINYTEFKKVYIDTLTELLNDSSYYQVTGGGFYVRSPAVKRLISLLADLEEMHPVWTERVEDWIEEEQIAKGYTYHLNV
jgi:hypothetical protein